MGDHREPPPEKMEEIYASMKSTPTKSTRTRFGQHLLRRMRDCFGDMGKDDENLQQWADVPRLEHFPRFIMPPPQRNKGTPAIVLLKEGPGPAKNKSVRGGRFSVLPMKEEEELLSNYEVAVPENKSLISLNFLRLGNQFSCCRRVRGDGNNFYRAFIVAYMEHIVESEDAAEIARFKEIVNHHRPHLTDTKHALYKNIFNTIDGTLKKLESMIGVGNDKSLSQDHLMEIVSNTEVSEYFVQFSRLVTAAEIKKKETHDIVLPAADIEEIDFGIPSDGTSFIDPGEFINCPLALTMGVEVNEYQITAFCSALGVPIRVYYLDRPPAISNASVASNIYPSLPSPDAASPSQVPNESGDIEPLIELAFWSGHYDILYRRKG